MIAEVDSSEVVNPSEAMMVLVTEVLLQKQGKGPSGLFLILLRLLP